MTATMKITHKAELIWQVVEDGGRDDCSFAVKKTEPDQLN